MKSECLIVIGRLSYPRGSAPSNRVHLYCKAFKLAKGFPFIINLHSVFTRPQLFNYFGRYEGVPFYYPQKSNLLERRFLKRNIKKFYGLINTFIIVGRLKKKHRIKVLFYSPGLLNELVLFLMFKYYGISIIKECCEAPDFLIKNKKNIFFDKLLLKLNLKLYDEIIVISDFLNKYYSAIFPANRIHQIPILVDLERFDKLIYNKNNNKQTITYVGYMVGNKDGLINLIEAMAIVSTKVKDLHLNLVGAAPKSDLKKIINKVETLNLQNKIFFLGSKGSDEIPSILSDSDLLVLARPNNNQAKAGFPTKLGEYLASGRPVVITKTGEISKYLTDNCSAYLATPDDINNFAEKIIYAINDVNKDKIGRKGYEIAKNNFDYKLYSKKILQIVQNRKQ
jgi:glycosyltransferase involved in cell wall biosynthesis